MSPCQSYYIANRVYKFVKETMLLHLGRHLSFKSLEMFFFIAEEEFCPIPMDTTFVIDSSDCENLKNWNIVLKFVQTLVSFFDVSQTVGRIALVPFSTDAEVVLKFNNLTGSLLNSEEVNRRVGLLQCKGGLREIDKALELVNNEVLTPQDGMRNVSRVKFTPSVYYQDSQLLQNRWKIDLHVRRSFIFFPFMTAGIRHHDWKANSGRWGLHSA